MRQVITHPDFDALRLANDVALIELDGSGGSGGVRVNGDQDLDEGSARVAGYGATESEARDSGVLRVVDVPVVGIDECKSLLRNARFDDFALEQNVRNIARVIRAETQMCAGYEDGGCDSCQVRCLFSFFGPGFWDGCNVVWGGMIPRWRLL